MTGKKETAGQPARVRPSRQGALWGAALLLGVGGVALGHSPGGGSGGKPAGIQGANSGSGSGDSGGKNDSGGQGDAAGHDGEKAGQAPVTYCRDVAPILQDNCQECHHPGGIGPFALLTYPQARAWAGVVREVTQAKIMPPWKAAAGYGEFEDERRLTEAQIATLARWVDQGSPEGDPKDLPPPRQFTEGWRLGTPDLVLDAGAPYLVPANQGDLYRAFVLPFHPDKDQWVTAIEVLPGAGSVVHHIDLYLDPRERSPAADKASPGLGFPTAGFGPDLPGVVQLDAWAAGAVPRFLPAGTAWKIPAKAYLVMEVHYSPTARPVGDRTRIGLHFARGPVDKRARTSRVGNERFRVPAGAPHYEVTAGTPLPGDITLLSVWPHMHLIGHELRGTATLPGGIAKPLIWIQEWDVHWQLSYAYKEAQKLPKGARLDLSAFYDNSSQNPRNPNQPPRPISFGPGTTDEMCYLFFRYTVDAEHLTRGQAVEKDGIEGVNLGG